MSHSKNNFPVPGGSARQTITFISARNTYDIRTKLINPETNKPYKNEQLLKDLLQNKSEFPASELRVCAYLEKLGAAPLDNPQADFVLHCYVKKEKDTKQLHKATEAAQNQGKNQIKELAVLLFRPYWSQEVKENTMTVQDFYDCVKDSLFLGECGSAHKHMHSACRKYLLPMIGSWELGDLTPEAHGTLISKLNAQLHGRCQSTHEYVRRALESLLQYAQSFGASFAGRPENFGKGIRAVDQKNIALTKAFALQRLDDAERTKIFEAASQQEDAGYSLLLLALLYSGMDYPEIAAHSFQDFKRILLKSGHAVYVILITQRVNEKTHRVNSVNYPEFPFERFRKVILYPWAAELLEQRIKKMQIQGWNTKEIGEMKLSDIDPQTRQRSLTEHMNHIIKLANLIKHKLPRTAGAGKVNLQSRTVNYDTLKRDAQAVAVGVCGGDNPMQKAMFGTLGRTTTDKKSYLDILGNQYAVARYHKLGRFEPVSKSESGRTLTASDVSLCFGTQPGLFRVAIHNSGESEQVIRITGNYGFWANWEVKE